MLYSRKLELCMGGLQQVWAWPAFSQPACNQLVAMGPNYSSPRKEGSLKVEMRMHAAEQGTGSSRGVCSTLL
ncbi:hypothetical protein WJX74_010991 [Apatococcus lobatus]|uniref:Uncharacterized protein n=1 Tax=Apatococcus lobatus TaxID=904363 RepID=A0AAW1S506_9CHLO